MWKERSYSMIKNKEKFYGLLGLAMRAGKIVSGEELSVQEIKNNRAKCVILAGDASEGTKKKIQNKCCFYQVPVIIGDHRVILGNAIGKDERVVIAVCDSGFTKKLMTYI